MSDKPNPLCACGCGLEVSRPWHKWIQGHASPRKLSREAIIVAKAALERKVPQAVIARVIGVTSAVVCSIGFGMLDHRITEGETRFVPSTARRHVMRSAEIEANRLEWKERKELVKARRDLKAMKAYLRSLKNGER
jgi:hypothetical protein